MFQLTEPIETERLLLRAYTADDGDDMYAMRSDPELTRWTPLKVTTRAESDLLLVTRMRDTTLAEDDDILSLAAVRRSDGWLVGQMTLWVRSFEHRQGEIGYVFRHEAQGHGFATEAAEALLRLGFETLGLHRIFALAYAANGASTAVMARLGMQREALLRETEYLDGAWQSDETWSILEHEWRARPATP